MLVRILHFELEDIIRNLEVSWDKLQKKYIFKSKLRSIHGDKCNKLALFFLWLLRWHFHFCMSDMFTNIFCFLSKRIIDHVGSHDSWIFFWLQKFFICLTNSAVVKSTLSMCELVEVSERSWSKLMKCINEQ